MTNYICIYCKEKLKLEYVNMYEDLYECENCNLKYYYDTEFKSIRKQINNIVIHINLESKVTYINIPFHGHFTLNYMLDDMSNENINKLIETLIKTKIL